MYNSIWYLQHFLYTGIILIVIHSFLLLLMLTQGSKRCHDIGINGWYQLIPLFVFYMICKKGKTYNNKFVDQSEFSEIDNIGH